MRGKKRNRIGPGRQSHKTHQITTRLDESLPLKTEDWLAVEKILVHLTEFAPRELLTNLNSAIASFADDQARRGYVLGQEDMTKGYENLVA